MAWRMWRPTAVDPVNATLSMPVCVTIFSPTVPSPVKILTTPLGKPASLQISAKSNALRDVYSAGLSTTVLPIASAGAIFQASISSGKFQGITCPATPSALYSGISSSIN